MSLGCLGLNRFGGSGAAAPLRSKSRARALSSSPPAISLISCSIVISLRLASRLIRPSLRTAKLSPIK